MKASELQIFDWVHIGEEACRVSQIREDGIMTDAYNDIYEDEWINPIPLTPEILEKNGFAADGHCAYVKGDVTVYPATNKDHFTEIDHPVLSVWRAGHVRELQIRCDYVHILQHALRLCGLTELADSIII